MSHARRANLGLQRRHSGGFHARVTATFPQDSLGQPADAGSAHPAY